MTSTARIQQLETLFIEKFQEKYKLTERDLKKAFSIYDKDKNGVLDSSELLACMSTYLNGVSRQEVQALVDCYDVNGDGKLSYEEFFQFLTHRSATADDRQRTNRHAVSALPDPPPAKRLERAGRPSSRESRESREYAPEEGARLTSRHLEERDRQYSRRVAAVPRPPSEPSDMSSFIDLNDEGDLCARATSYLSSLKSLLVSKADSVKSRCRMADRLSVHNRDLVAALAKDIITKAFEPYLMEGTYDSHRAGRRYGRAPVGTNLSGFIKILRQFTKTGTAVIHPEVAKRVWSMCKEASDGGCLELLEPEALYTLLFEHQPVGHSEDHLIRGGILPLDSVQVNHPETVGDSFKSGLKQQQALNLPPPPPGSFKKIIAHPTRTLLTVPANFDPVQVDASNRLPNYDASMEHVFGMSNCLYSGKQIFVTSDSVSKKPLLVYPSAAVGVMHDPTTNKQRFLNGHTDDIICMGMSNDGKILATGQIGKGAFVNVWSLRAQSCTANPNANDMFVTKSEVLSGKNGPAPSSSSPSWVCTIGGKDGYSPNFFQRGVCAVELSPTGRYVLAIGCDDKHRMGIWDITRGGELVCDTVTQNGLPPQIKGVYWCPERQPTGDFVSREHCGDCEMFVTIGVHHMKFWSFADKNENFISSSSSGGSKALISRAGKIEKKLNVSQPGIFLCAAYVMNSNGPADLVAGGSNGIVYLYRQGVCVVTSTMGKKPAGNSQVVVAPSASATATDSAASASSITNPYAVYAIVVAHNQIFCSGRGGTVHCLDNRTLQKLSTISLFGASPERPPSSASSRAGVAGRSAGNMDNSAASAIVSGLAVLVANTGNHSEASGKVSKRDKHLRLVATTNQGVAKYISLSVAGNGSVSLEKPPAGILHYHMGSLWGLAVDHCRRSSSSGFDGKVLVSAGDDKMVAVWDTRTWKQICRAKTQAAARCCHLDEPRRYIAVGLASGGVLVYSLQLSGGDDEDIVSTYSGNTQRAGSSRGGARPLSSGSNRGHESRSKPTPVTGTLTQRVYRKDSNMEISDVKFDSRGTQLAVGSHDRCVYLYEMVANGKGTSINYNLRLLYRLQGHNAYITHLDWSSDNQMIRSTCGAYELLFWGAADGRQITTSIMNESWRTNTCVLGYEVMGIWPSGSDGTDVNALDVCKECNIVATADDFGTLKLLNYPCIVKHAPGRAYGGHCSHVVCTRFYSAGENNSSTYLATTGGNDAALVVWRVKPIYT